MTAIPARAVEPGFKAQAVGGTVADIPAKAAVRIDLTGSDYLVVLYGRAQFRIPYRKVNTLDFPVAPRGYRVLGQIPRVPKLVVQKIIHAFGGLEEVLAVSDASLEAVDGVGPTRAKDIREGLRRLQEVDLVDRYLQS